MPRPSTAASRSPTTSQAGGLDTVNGGIRVGTQAQIGGGVETVNGEHLRRPRRQRRRRRRHRQRRDRPGRHRRRRRHRDRQRRRHRRRRLARARAASRSRSRTATGRSASASRKPPRIVIGPNARGRRPAGVRARGRSCTCIASARTARSPAPPRSASTAPTRRRTDRIDTFAPRLPGFSDVLAAAARIAPHAHVTPVLRSRSLDALAGCEIAFQVRAPAARRRVQVPRRLQRGVVAGR